MPRALFAGLLLLAFLAPYTCIALWRTLAHCPGAQLYWGGTLAAPLCPLVLTLLVSVC